MKTEERSRHTVWMEDTVWQRVQERQAQKKNGCRRISAEGEAASGEAGERPDAFLRLSKMEWRCYFLKSAKSQ